jgi:predicted phage terminase large subunit-like protein
VRADFGYWCEVFLAPLGQYPARHHRLLIEKLTAVSEGKIDRLMFLLPPGSAKSTYASVLFAAWWFCQHKRSTVIAASHTGDLAEHFSRQVRNLVEEHGVNLGWQLRADNKAVGSWSNSDGSQYFAVGIGGAVAGRRADLVIIDDPVRSQEAADSPRDREKVWSWYQSDLLTRLKPGGRIVVIQTRWHADDLGGRLLQAQKEMPGADKWEVISLPAIAGSGDALGRAPGEALWPEWEGVEALNRKRKNMSERTWSALFQQSPTTAEGAIIRRNMWRHWTDAAPRKPACIVIALDTAYTDKTQNDATGCAVFHLVDTDYFPERTRPGEPVPTPDMRSKCLLRFAWRERLAFPELITHILETVEAFKLPGVPMRLLIEAKASGLSVIQEMRRLMPYLIIDEVVPKGDKVARAHSVTAMFEQGRVYAMARTETDGPAFRPWADMVIDECGAFPVGQHDDLVDATVMALRYFRDSGVEFFFEDGPEIPKAGTLPHKMQF